MADPLRLALVGCGRQGRGAFVPAVRAAADAELTAFVDTNPQAAHLAAGGSGQIFTDVDDLANAGAADAAIVATPHASLAETALRCIEAGLHVLVEKPCGRDHAEARQVAQAAAERGLVFMPGYCLRFHEARMRLHEFLWRGLAGAVTGLVATKGSPPYDGWLADPDAGGGPLLYVASHVVDQLLWLHGERVERVLAQSTDRPQTGAENWVSAVLTFADGVHATLHVSQATGVHIDVLEVIGSGGRVRSDMQTAALTVESTESRELEAPATLHTRSASDENLYLSEVTEFVGAVRGGRQPSVAGIDAVRALAVLDAVRESASTGAVVEVNDPWDGTTPIPACTRSRCACACSSPTRPTRSSRRWCMSFRGDFS